MDAPATPAAQPYGVPVVMDPRTLEEIVQIVDRYERPLTVAGPRDFYLVPRGPNVVH